MELIIGGAYQGKLTYAVKKYGFSKEDLFDLAEGLPGREYRCYYHLEALSRRGLSSAEILALIPENAVVISREIGAGIVPMDPAERLWREAHGAVLRALAERADSVTRIFCGFAEVIK